MENGRIKKSGSTPEVRVLIPVWGERYIDDFIKFALPSLLAPGNLPVLARACRVTVVFLTARRNFDHFQKQTPISKVLADLCKIEYLSIDDLIQGASSYSVPLTLAYFRGMTETGDAMTHTYFLCYNSDFILANDSLKTVLRHIQDERSIILAPSFRVTRETVKPVLKEHLRSAKGQLSMQPREMARLAFSNIHPTVISRIINQTMFHSDYPNQIYWRVDPDTILARFYLIMQLCIRPERRVESINNFVDYAFLPEMCPSGDMAVIADSDEFFMMELQATDAENRFIRPGPAKIPHVAQSLSDWTTAQHRDISRHELIFHTAELPQSLSSARDQLEQFMKKVERRLVPQPVPHDRHHYWPGAVQTWLYGLQNYLGRPTPPLNDTDEPRSSFANEDQEGAAGEKDRHFSGIRWQLCPQGLGYYLRIRRWKSLLLGLFWGLPPHVRLWHPDWGTFAWVRSWLHRLGIKKNEPVLYVTDETDFDGFFTESASVTKVLPRDLLGGFLHQVSKHGSDSTVCFVHLTEGDMELAREIVSYVQANLPSVQRILLYVGQSLNERSFQSVRIGFALSQYFFKSVDCTTISTLVSYFSATFPGRVQYRFMGGRVHGRIHRLFQERSLQEMFIVGNPLSWRRNIIFAGRIFLYGIAMAAANIWNSLRADAHKVPRGCTAVAVDITLKTPVHAAEDVKNHVPRHSI